MAALASSPTAGSLLACTCPCTCQPPKVFGSTGPRALELATEAVEAGAAGACFAEAADFASGAAFESAAKAARQNTQRATGNHRNRFMESLSKAAPPRLTPDPYFFDYRGVRKVSSSGESGLLGSLVLLLASKRKQLETLNLKPPCCSPAAKWRSPDHLERPFSTGVSC